MKKGDIIEISFTGRDKASGRVFETTDAETARKEGIYRENFSYGVFPVAVGRGELLKGLEEALLEMKPGEAKTLLLPPEKAFGPRNPELVALVPLQEFKKRKLAPVPGMPVEINNRQGKVQSVSGGRVRVDFNPELAGKTLEYELKVERQLTNPLEQTRAFLKKYFSFLKELPGLSLKEGILEVKLAQALDPRASALKTLYAKTVIDFIEPVKKVRFVEEFDALSFKEKPKPE